MKVLHSICQQIWKLSSGHRTGKGPFSLQSQRWAVPKNVHTTTVFTSQASKVTFKILQGRLQQYINRELPDVHAGLEKAEEPEIKLPTTNSRKNIFCFIDYAKAFDSVDHNKLKSFSSDGNTKPPYLLPEKSVCRSRSNS